MLEYFLSPAKADLLPTDEKGGSSARSDPPSGYGPVHSAGLDCRGCKAVSYGRNILMNANYNLKQSILAREDSYNDLGVKFDTKLKFDCHINEKVNKAYGILGIIKRYFYYYVKRLCMVTPPSGID